MLTFNLNTWYIFICSIILYSLLHNLTKIAVSYRNFTLGKHNQGTSIPNLYGTVFSLFSFHVLYNDNYFSMSIPHSRSVYKETYVYFYFLQLNLYKVSCRQWKSAKRRFYEFRILQLPTSGIEKMYLHSALIINR